MYGLLAEAIAVAPDKSSISFRLHPKARFYQRRPGDRRADVKHSFEPMSGKYAAPGLRAVAGRRGAGGGAGRAHRALRPDASAPTTCCSPSAGCACSRASGRWGRTASRSASTRSSPSTRSPAGPTRSPRPIRAARLEFKRNPDYWARDLGVRRGMFNFDRVVYRYYTRPGGGARGLQGRRVRHLQGIQRPQPGCASTRASKWDDGRISKDLFETSVGQGLQAYMLNMRRPLFQDIRVREALGYTYDFDTVNRLGLYKRADSQFNNSEFAAAGPAVAGRAEAAGAVPRRAAAARCSARPSARRRTGRDPKRLRQNLLKARELLEQAGWKLAPTASCATPRARPSSSSTWSPASAGRMTDWQTQPRRSWASR